MRQTAVIDGVLKTSLRLGFLCAAVFLAASSGVVAFAWALAIVPCLWLNWRSVKRRLASGKTRSDSSLCPRHPVASGKSRGHRE